MSLVIKSTPYGTSQRNYAFVMSDCLGSVVLFPMTWHFIISRNSTAVKLGSFRLIQNWSNLQLCQSQIAYDVLRHYTAVIFQASYCWCIWNILMALPVQHRLRNKTGDKKLFTESIRIYTYIFIKYISYACQNNRVPMEKEKIACSELKWNHSDQILQLLADNVPC